MRRVTRTKKQPQRGMKHFDHDVGIYISLIIPAGFWAVAIVSREYDRFLFTPFFVLGVLTFLATLLLSVIGLFKGPWLLRRHLLLWYGCLFALILAEVFVEEYFYSAKLANNILALGIVVLLVLPIIWLRTASRS